MISGAISLRSCRAPRFPRRLRVPWLHSRVSRFPLSVDSHTNPGPRTVDRVRGRPVSEYGAYGRQLHPFVFTRSVDRSSHTFSSSGTHTRVLGLLLLKNGTRYPPEVDVSRLVTLTRGRDLPPSFFFTRSGDRSSHSSRSSFSLVSTLVSSFVKIGVRYPH